MRNQSKKLVTTEVNPGTPSIQAELETASPKGPACVPCALQELVLLLTGEHFPLIPQPLRGVPALGPHLLNTPHSHDILSQQLGSSRRHQPSPVPRAKRGDVRSTNPFAFKPPARGVGKQQETLNPTPGTQLQGLHEGRAPAQLAALQQRPLRLRGTAGAARRPCPARVPLPAAPRPSFPRGPSLSRHRACTQHQPRPGCTRLRCSPAAAPRARPAAGAEGRASPGSPVPAG